MSLALETTEQIADFLERYCHVLDDGRVDEWSAFFQDDAVYQITTRQNVLAKRPIGIVLCEGRGMLDDRIKALKHANIFEEHVYRHIVGRPLIESLANGRHAVHSSFAVYRTMYTGEIDIFATGVYADIVVTSSGGPRFAERRVILDSRSIDTLMVYPL
jgi:3-phenylpropionate/cinnamic acid dioxygenase small subunit